MKIVFILILIALALATLVYYWISIFSIGKFDKPIPKQVTPALGESVPANPTFTFEFSSLHQKFVTCDGFPVLSDENGEIISDLQTEASDTSRTIIPNNTFTPGELLFINYEIACSTGLLFIADELVFGEVSRDKYRFEYVVGD